MSDRTIVITGASDGIGAAAARELSRRGDQVVVVGRSPDKTRAVAAEIGADHFLADYSELGQVRDLADQLLARYPRIDVLINNAGAVMNSPGADRRRSREDLPGQSPRSLSADHSCCSIG